MAQQHGPNSFYITPHIHHLNSFEPADRERLLTAHLDALDSGASAGRVKIGYTLRFPVLNFYRKSNSDWIIDLTPLDQALEVARRVGRPFVVTLTCNHFGNTPHSQLESELLQEPVNLMQYADGSPAIDGYFTVSTLPFTLSTNPVIPVNTYRFTAIRAAVHRIGDFARQNPGLLVGLSLHGEAHHMYADIKHGTGRFDDIRTTDYSPIARTEFAQYLDSRKSAIREVFQDSPPVEKNITPPWQGNHRSPAFEAAPASTTIIPIVGWAYHPEGADSVEVLLNGSCLTSARINIPREDVRQAVPGAGPACGFMTAIDGALLPSGNHRLQVMVKLHSGARPLLAERTINIVNDFIAAHPTATTKETPEEDPRLQGYLEHPATEVKINLEEPWVRLDASAALELWDTYTHGTTPIFGWVDHPAGIDAVRIYLNGRPIGNALLGLNRMDVYDAVAEVESPNVGFRFDLDFSDLTTGIYSLKVVVKLDNGQEAILAERSLRVVNHFTRREAFLDGESTSPLPPTGAGGLRGHLDSPPSAFRVIYNPHARLWQQFRTHQVSVYMEYLQEMAIAEGLDPDLLFSYQLMPWLFGSWNDLLFSVGPECFTMKHSHPGVTLYGGLTLSPLPFRWITDPRYGVLEFNPMMAKDPKLSEMAFRYHLDRGAVFVSPYFMCFPKHLAAHQQIEHGMFLIDPQAPTQVGRYIYGAIQRLARSED